MEEASGEAGRDQRSGDPDGRAGQAQGQAVTQDEAQDVRRPGPERQADPELAGSPGGEQ